MDVTFSGRGGFMSVDLLVGERNCGNNSDEFTIILRADGQMIETGGVEVDELAFKITGPLEFANFLEAMELIKRMGL